jgi:hypothetical protein
MEIRYGKTLESYAFERQIPLQSSYGSRCYAARDWRDYTAEYDHLEFSTVPFLAALNVSLPATWLTDLGLGGRSYQSAKVC